MGNLRLAGRMTDGVGIRRRSARKYPSYALMLVTRGHGRYRDSQHDMSLARGDVVLVFPDHPHWYGVMDGTTWDELYLAFSGPVFTLAEESGLISRSTPVMTLGTDPRWAARIDSFRTRPAPTSVRERDLEAVEVLTLLTDIAVVGGRAHHREQPEDWREISRRLLSTDLHADLALPDVAAACGLPYETWRRRFRDVVGVSPARYRTNARIGAAQSMLRLSSLSVREIAIAVGFTDEQHLNRHFRSAINMTARQYRESPRG